MYQVIDGPAQIPAGTVLQLSEAQASLRRHQLRRLERGWFITLMDVVFEIGEVLTFCSVPSAAVLSALTPPEMRQPPHGHPNHRPRVKGGA